jgi:hypothetical protein
MSRIRVALAAIVTAVWIFGYGQAYVSHTQTPTELSGLMAVVLGWAFAGEVRDAIRRRSNGNGDGDE